MVSISSGGLGFEGQFFEGEGIGAVAQGANDGLLEIKDGGGGFFCPLLRRVDGRR